MSNLASGEDGSDNADAEVLQKVKQEYYPIFMEKLMLDARRDAIIDVFIEKCSKGVSGDFIPHITTSSRFHLNSQLTDDDAAFISELKAELLRDLRYAGVLKAHHPERPDPDIYIYIESDVTQRVEIWAASQERSEDLQPAHRESFLESAILAGSCSSPSAYEELQSFKDGGAPTLGQLSEERGLELLSSAVQGEQATATFACGGSIKVRAPDDNTSTDKDGQLFSPPVVLRWDNCDKTATHRVELPQPRGQEHELDMLLRDCQPATFGLGGVDVLDESYRKASKLDNTEFSTNFSPHDYGIVDTIAQILFPSVEEDGSGDLGLELRGVRAELYKLNIYSGPSGMFHPHVDTPRGEGQFGSLVVCLPSAHSGGQLLVRHEGTTVTFDWSITDVSTHCIQWAAFYSDCEHEVLEVTTGHRLTLTYNLYLREHTCGALGRTLIMSPEQLPLYGIVKDLLDQPGFLREDTDKGALLGFFCSHEYAHTHGSPSVRVPRSLKGVDMAIFAIFQALGLQIEILPIMELGGHGNQLYFGGRELQEIRRLPTMLEKLKMYRRRRHPPATTVERVGLAYDVHIDSYGESDDAGNREVTSLEDYKDVETRLQSILRKRKIRGFSTEEDFVIAGTQLHRMVLCDRGGDSDDLEDNIRNDVWPNDSLPGVQWLNKANYTNSALTHLAYGNEATLFTHYSAATLLVIVPPSSERGPFHIRRTSKRRHSEEDAATSGT